MNKAYTGSILIAVAGILFWVLVLPMYDHIADARDALATRKTQIQDREKVLADIASLTKQYMSRTNDVTRFANVVPPTKNSADLVSMIQALTSQNGLQLGTLALSDSSQQTLGAAVRTQYVTMDTSGSYLSFKSFLEALEKNIRIMDIQSIDGNPVEGSTSNIIFHIKASAYYLLP